MARAPLDVLAYVPCPCCKANAGTASLFNAELLAYGSSSAAVVVDVRLPACLPLATAPYSRSRPSRQPLRSQVQQLTIVASLVGAHRNASVSALAW